MKMSLPNFSTMRVVLIVMGICLFLGVSSFTEEKSLESLVQAQRIKPPSTVPPSPSDQQKLPPSANGDDELQTNTAIPLTEESSPRHGRDVCPAPGLGYTVNFENIKVIELIRFISQISNTNFIFNNEDIAAISTTIISQDPTSVDDLMAALMQILQMHGLSVLEQGKNVIISKQATPISRMSTVVTEDNAAEACDKAIVTRVFRIYNISPIMAQSIIKPLVSPDATVEVSPETRHLILSDITANVDKVADLLNALDTPNAALDIAEYAVTSAYPMALVAYAKEILAPLAQTNPLQMIAQPSSHKIFIVSTPFLIHKALTVLKSLDTVEITDVMDLPPSAMVNSNFYVYKLNYQDGREIASAIRTIGSNLQSLGVSNVELVNTIYSIEWIEVNNSLVITGTQESIDKVVALIRDLDAAPDQIFIEVLIIDTTIQNALNFGVQWVALGNEQNKLAFASGLLNTTGAGSLLAGAQAAMNNPPPNAGRGDVPLSPGFGLGVVGNIISHNGEDFLTLGALVNALESESDSVIVQNPRIMTEDTQQANFFVGQNIPYQTTNTIIRDTGSVTQNIQYEDIGVQLRVTPQVGPDRVVTLQIDESISDIVSSTVTVNTIGGGSTQLLAPTTTKTLTSTRVHVPDGAFLVMSGHIRDEKSFTRSGIPCLGTLPLVGPAFSTTLEFRKKRNLILFIRPHVIRTIDEGLCLTNQEGYDYNWESHPCSIIECGTERAPECETYPPARCPTN